MRNRRTGYGVQGLEFGVYKKIFLLFSLLISHFSFVYSVSFRYAIIPENPRPGETVTIGVNNSSGARTVALLAGGKRLARSAFFSVPAEDGKPSFLAAVLPVPSTAKPGMVTIVFEAATGILGEIPLEITAREFVSEVIELNPVLTGVRTDPDPKKTAESARLQSIINHTGNEVFCYGSFVPPVTATRRTSFFGDRRVYKYSNGGTDTSIHAGIDYGVPKGTVVTSCGPGRVVLACPRIVTGNSIVIEHLPGVYSLYYHLDKIEVEEGLIVATGAPLGLSGSTGLATGPHLHWEIRVSGENSDPDAFIARPVLDKDAILSKINN
jgi:murein DD-endopeptidase MepM/ murein hydrolase activator NlpD